MNERKLHADVSRCGTGSPSSIKVTIHNKEVFLLSNVTFCYTNLVKLNLLAWYFRPVYLRIIYVNKLHLCFYLFLLHFLKTMTSCL